MKSKDLNCKECVYDHCDITELPCRNCKDEYSNFKLEDLIKAVEEINKLPPVAVRIEMYQEGYFVLKNQADEYVPHELDFYVSICGIAIEIKDYIEDVKKSECKVYFSDGSTKVLPVYKTRGNRNETSKF